MALADELRTSQDAIGCVFFDAAGDRWGARLADIDRVLVGPQAPIVPIPHAPGWVKGVFHYEMQIATMIDLSLILVGRDIERRRHPRHDSMLIIDFHETLVGLLVANLSLEVSIALSELRFVDDTSAAQRYVAATYAPQGVADPEVGASAGILDLRRIVAECVAALEGGESSHV